MASKTLSKIDILDIGLSFLTPDLWTGEINDFLQY